jgi:hypothetical protein
MLIIRRINCINTTSGMSLGVGDRLVCRSGRNFPTCTLDSLTKDHLDLDGAQTTSLGNYPRFPSQGVRGISCVFSLLLLLLFTCIVDGHLHRLTHTRCCIDTIDSPEDVHEVARNMYRIEINI